MGSYNALLKNSLPKEFQYYKADEETFESSHESFRSAFPRGFAWEVITVYSGPPVIAFKFRHWGIFEGPFQGHAPTEEKVEFYGLGTVKVCFYMLIRIPNSSMFSLFLYISFRLYISKYKQLTGSIIYIRLKRIVTTEIS